MYYAQLNGAGVCVAVTQTSGAFNSPTMIALSFLDDSRLGMRYSNGVWSQ